MTNVIEPTSIGLSERAHVRLKRLKEEQHFGEMVDAYRLGIALALAHGVRPEEVASRTTIFSVATLDPDREIATAIKALIDVGSTPVYKWAERLAEWGVTELSIRAESGDLDFQKLFQEVANVGEA